jgi:hypothetical protein
MGEVGAPGAGLGHGPDRGPGRKPTAHTTTNRKKNANKKPKRDGARLNTTSDKRNMLRHDATTMCHTRVLGVPRPGREHNHQVCWDQVSHI